MSQPKNKSDLTRKELFFLLKSFIFVGEQVRDSDMTDEQKALDYAEIFSTLRGCMSDNAFAKNLIKELQHKQAKPKTEIIH